MVAQSDECLCEVEAGMVLFAGDHCVIHTLAPLDWVTIKAYTNSCYLYLQTCLTVQTDRFVLEAVDLGKLFKVKIRHDDTNFSSDWFLDRVEVHDPDSPSPYVFHCERWLAKKKDGGKLERSLYVKVCHVAEFKYSNDNAL